MQKINRRTSDQIKYCRFLCIFFMIIVHIPPGIENFTNYPFHFEIFKILINDILGRASVSALSFISGYLIFHSLQRHSWLSLIKSRFSSLILPMAFWNLFIIAVGLLIFKLVGQKNYIVLELDDLTLPTILIDRVFSINYGAASDSLNFLRDIFVCVLLSLPLVWLTKRFSWLVVLALFVIELLYSFQPIVMRGMILIFFSLGIVFAYKFDSFSAISKLFISALMGFLVVLSVEYSPLIFGVFTEKFPFYDLFKRFCVSILAINFSLFLAKTVKSRIIDKIDRATYFIFLSHNVAFTLFWGVWQTQFGRSLEFPYVFYYLLAPVFWTLIVVNSMPILKFLPSWIQRVVNGKNFETRRS